MKRLIPLLITLTIFKLSGAIEFNALSPSGHMLHYTTVSSTSSYVEVTAPAEGYSTTLAGSVVIPATVTYNNTTYTVRALAMRCFYGCSQITAIHLPEGVCVIGTFAFRNCSMLNYAYLPTTLDSIATNAFAGCQHLTRIVAQAAVPPTIRNANVFDNVPTASATLVVPTGSSAAYRTAVGWSLFQNISEATMPDTFNVARRFTILSSDNTLGTTIGSGVYTLGDTVTIAAIARRQMIFSGWSDFVHDNPRRIVVSTDTTITAYFSNSNVTVLHDTVLRLLHDTIYVPLHDTTAVAVHDTLFVRDTIHDTTTIVGYIFDSIYFYDTVYIDTFLIHDTVYIDTLVIHDTVYLHPDGIEGADAPAPRLVVTADGHVVVEGAAGEPLLLYDLQGRCLYRRLSAPQRTVIPLPARGAYIIKAGHSKAVKIVWPVKE